MVLVGDEIRAVTQDFKEDRAQVPDGGGAGFVCSPVVKLWRLIARGSCEERRSFSIKAG